MNRRSFLRIALPAALPVAAASCGCREVAHKDAEGSELTLEGTAFGTATSVTVAGTSRPSLEKILEGADIEIARLESIFSLFEPDSPLRQLNRDGRLKDPPPEMVEALRICGHVHQLTGGAFDPSVQPLWDLYENHFALNPGDAEGPGKADLARARELIGWDRVDVGDDLIAFKTPGMALTLNGIAPGFAADLLARWLTDRNLDAALIDTGEFRAVGSRLDGSPWKVGIRVGDDVVDHVDLIDSALATSSGSGTEFDLEGRFHHLFNPKKDQFSQTIRTISVEAPEAALADALATAGGVMATEDFERAVAPEPDVRVRIFENC